MGDTMRPPLGGRPRGLSTGEPAAGPGLAQAMELGTELFDAARDSATALLDEQRTRAANEIGAFGDVLRRSVQSLDQAGGKAVARLTDGAARQISQFADGLHRSSLGEISGNIEDFARRYPMPFIASVIGAGFIAGRLMMSSSSRPTEQNLAGQNPAEPTTPQFSPSRPANGGEEPAGERTGSAKFGSDAASRGSF